MSKGEKIVKEFRSDVRRYGDFTDKPITAEQAAEACDLFKPRTEPYSAAEAYEEYVNHIQHHQQRLERAGLSYEKAREKYIKKITRTE